MFSLRAEVPNKEHDYVRRSWHAPARVQAGRHQQDIVKRGR